jgi:biopolymer transport protein ExbB/TolQ
MDFVTVNNGAMSPVHLFLQADIIVKIVMAGLFLASLWTWAIIFSFWFKLAAAKKAVERFEAEYREADDIDEFHRRTAGRDQAIAASKNTALAVVAPGIAEALLATALGLLAAIPAVIAYNKLSNDASKISQRLEGFADEFAAILSRQVDERVN